VAERNVFSSIGIIAHYYPASTSDSHSDSVCDVSLEEARIPNIARGETMIDHHRKWRSIDLRDMRVYIVECTNLHAKTADREYTGLIHHVPDAGQRIINGRWHDPPRCILEKMRLRAACDFKSCRAHRCRWCWFAKVLGCLSYLYSYRYSCRIHHEACRSERSSRLDVSHENESVLIFYIL